MKCKAKIVDLKPADPGFYYPTYEYTINGKTERTTSDNAIVVNPWDMDAMHDIHINENGEIKQDATQGIICMLVIMGGFFSIPILFSIIGESVFGLIFMLLALLPIFIWFNGWRTASRRRNAMQRLTPITGKIIWYKEVVTRKKNSTSVRHYPIVEYTYLNNTMSACLPDSEEPVCEGENREFYLDIPHKDVFTEKSTKHTGFFGAIAGLLITMPFFFVGLMLMIPEDGKEQIYEFIANMFVEFQNVNMDTFIPNIMPYIIIGTFGIFLLPVICITATKLIQMHNAKRNGDTLTAHLVKTNDYGRRHVSVYEYMYMGQMHKFQSSLIHDSTVDLYVNQRTGKAYCKNDFTAEYVKLGIIVFMIVMAILSSSVFASNMK